jgi:hypothetical protein
MQWPLTSQSRGSVSQRQHLVFFFVTDQTPRQHSLTWLVERRQWAISEGG